MAKVKWPAQGRSWETSPIKSNPLIEQRQHGAVSIFGARRGSALQGNGDGPVPPRDRLWSLPQIMCIQRLPLEAIDILMSHTYIFMPMRTTIRLDDSLLRQAKAAAAASGRSLNDLISDAVRAALVSRPTPGRVAELPTYRGRGLQPGVDLDDSAALLDIMSAGQLG